MSTTSDNQLYAAALTCRQFGTFNKPIIMTSLTAVSEDEAMGKAVAMARAAWRRQDYTEHTATLLRIPQAQIDAMLEQVQAELAHERGNRRTSQQAATFAWAQVEKLQAEVAALRNQAGGT